MFDSNHLELNTNRARPSCSHYALAFGYAWQQRTVQHCFIFCWTETVTDRCFYVNEGWGGGGAGDWVDASTWFAGQIFP